MLPSNLTNLVDLLRYRAACQPEKTAFIFLNNNETEAGRFTYGDLDSRSRAIAAHLQPSIHPGDRALLLYPPGLEFIAAFFGCLYAGVIAVPAYPPHPRRPLDRVYSIIRDAQAAIALTATDIFNRLEPQLADIPALQQLRWLVTEEIAAELAETWQPPELGPETLAFLQYTSGSTGNPKGVMVSHSNLLHNQAAIQHAFGHSPEIIGVGWLPLFHDMGLIGKVIQPLYLGIPCTLMSPLAFLQRPIRWLRAISRYRATTSGAPNFAYDLCVRKTTPEQREGLDLSSWQVAFNSAEPIHVGTLERFATAFEPYGFKRQAFYPCYGLAESTLFAAGNPQIDPIKTLVVEAKALANGQVISVKIPDNASDETEMDVRTLVSCGRAWLDANLLVVDPQSCRPCAPGCVGEIWLAGPSMAQGYWNRPEETAETFQAYLAETHEGPFLRTGDLGFLHNGELFVTGRCKDLLIIKGRNHYPQDIEWTVCQSHPALNLEGTAAFSVEINDEERLVIAQEVKRSHLADLDAAAAIGSIMEACITHHELRPYDVVLVKPARIPKTSSGKVQRYLCRQEFLAGRVDAIASLKSLSPAATASLFRKPHTA